MFRSSTKGFSHNEIPLFRALHTSLISLGSHVEEYHGNSHQVRFTGNGSYARTNARCELSDLMIITFSKVLKQARLTYLQAKSERAILPHVCGVEFSANLEQWYLLSNRPALNGIGAFNPPQDILSSALLPSVGTFCFFYKDIMGDFQIFYSCANHLAPPRNYAKKDGKLTAFGPCGTRVVSGYAECVATCGNICFADNLLSLRIGTPISLGSSKKNVATTRWISGIIRRQMQIERSKDRRTLLADELLELLGPEDDNNGNSGAFGAKTLLLIKANEENNER